MSMLAIWAAAAIATAGGAATAPTAPGPIPVPASATPINRGVTIAESNVVRTVDCGGADLAVNGSGDTLDVSGCATIVVPGSRNRIRAKLIPSSSISVFGDDNLIHWTPAPGWSPQVSSTGARNEINPVFPSRDAAPQPTSLPHG